MHSTLYIGILCHRNIVVVRMGLLCRDCSALCCQNINMPLNNREAGYMRRAGTEITQPMGPMTPSKTASRNSFIMTIYGKIFYQSPPTTEDKQMYYVRRCKLLLAPPPDGMTVFQMCSARGDRERPEICNILKPGGKRCRDIRRNAGYE